MAQMFVDPQKVEDLMRRLKAYTQETQNKEKQLKGFIKQTEQQWNDAHYKAFVEQYGEFEKLINKALQLSETVLLPNLQNVKQLAENYKNMGKR